MLALEREYLAIRSVIFTPFARPRQSQARLPVDPGCNQVERSMQVGYRKHKAPHLKKPAVLMAFSAVNGERFV